jgi:hypothetical protein
MKIILTENRFNDVLTNLIKKRGIRVEYMYFSHNMNRLTGTVYLYKNGEILGYRHGYDFSYKFDQRFGSLTYLSHFPNIEKLDMFRYLPEDNVIKYFSDNLVSHIKMNNSYLFK